ncbi:hypothetical protein Tco_1311504 [Tanacetum coccineum]
MLFSTRLLHNYVFSYYIYHIIVPSDSNVEDAFSSTHSLDYISALPDYSLASPGNTPSDSSDDLTKDLLALLAISPFHDDPYMKIGENYHGAPDTSYTRHKEKIETILNHLDELPLERIEHIEDIIKGLGKGRVTMALLPPGFLEHLYLDMINAQDIERMIPPTPPRDIKPPVGSPISLSPSSSNLDNRYGSLPRTTGKMAPKRTSTSAAPAMTQAAIRKLVVDSVAAALEGQAATMANIDNTNRNTRQIETHIARKCSYKELMNCQPFNFKGTEGAIGLIRWFERTESVFSRSNYTEDCKMKFSTGTLTKEALSWWNSFAQPIGIEEAYNTTWYEFKKLLIKKYCPQNEELAVLCPTMVPNSEKLMEVFIGGLPISIKGNVTALKPQTFEEAFPYQEVNGSGDDKSFVSISLASMLNIPPITLDTTYDIEIAMETYFDVVIGMDWLYKYQSRIIYDEKVIHIPIDEGIDGGEGVPLLFTVMHHIKITDCEIRYHPGKANVVANALSRKERFKPLRIILDPDDQPMWESAKTVAPTPNSTIVQIDVDDNFFINSTYMKMICENKFDGYLWANPHDHIREFFAICDMFKYGETQSEAVKLMIFSYSLSDKAKTWFNELNEESIISWDQMRKNMLRKCHGHGLTKGATIQIFYHGLDEPTQRILDITAGGIFLYKSLNQAFQFLEDKVLFEHYWPIKSKNEHHRKSVAFADGSDSNTDNSQFMAKLKAMDSQIISLNEELQDMLEKYNEIRKGNASKNDDTPMCEHHEANFIRYEDHQN